MWVADYRQTTSSTPTTCPTGTRDDARDFDTLIAAGNLDSSTGIWSDGTTMWVADTSEDKLYAYDLSGGVRVDYVGSGAFINL